MMIGKRSISLMTSWLPQMMIGIDTSRPKMTSGILWSPPAPSAAPAIAMTLSRLITKSATMTVFTAAHNLSLAWMLLCASSCSGNSSLMPIQNSSAAPTIFRYGICSRVSAKKIRMTRRMMAPAVPHRMPIVRCLGGSLRQASAMTTALSPPSTMSIMMIWPTASQNSVVMNCSMAACSSLGGPVSGRNRCTCLRHQCRRGLRPWPCVVLRIRPRGEAGSAAAPWPAAAAAESAADGLLQQLAHLRRVARDDEAALFHHRQLGLGRVGAA